MKIRRGSRFLALAMTLCEKLPRLPENALHLLFLLLQHCARETGSVDTSLETLSTELGRPRVVIGQSLKTLEAEHIVTVVEIGTNSRVTIADEYWAYSRSQQQTVVGQEYVDQVIAYMRRFRCIHPLAGERSRDSIMDWHRIEVSFEVTKRAILLGCSRKMMQFSKIEDVAAFYGLTQECLQESWLIKSFSYFRSMLSEAQNWHEEAYWSHLEKKLTNL